MPILANSAKEQVYSTSLNDGSLIILALFLKVRSIPVQDVNVSCRNVDLVEQILVHEAMIALRMAFWQSNIFIHIEGYDVLE